MGLVVPWVSWFLWSRGLMGSFVVLWVSCFDGFRGFNAFVGFVVLRFHGFVVFGFHAFVGIVVSLVS